MIVHSVSVVNEYALLTKYIFVCITVCHVKFASVEYSPFADSFITSVG